MVKYAQFSATFKRYTPYTDRDNVYIYHINKLVDTYDSVFCTTIRHSKSLIYLDFGAETLVLSYSKKKWENLKKWFHLKSDLDLNYDVRIMENGTYYTIEDAEKYYNINFGNV